MKDEVVCNTGPLIALGLLNRLDLLATRFGNVWIPRAVEQEILAGGVAAAAVESFRSARWIQVADLVRPLDPVLLALLDRGEAEVLAMASERSLQRILMDERKGRKVARTILGLHPIGIARLLVDAELGGQLPSAIAELQKLRQSGYWLDDALLTWAARFVQK